MSQVTSVRAFEKQTKPHSHESKADWIFVLLFNLFVVFACLQMDMANWLTNIVATQTVIYLPIAASLFLSLIYMLEKKRRIAVGERNKFMRESKHDTLTGLYNRQFFHDSARIEMERTKRVPSTFSVVMLDIDDFKKINDTEGHAIGDAVLTEFAQVLENTVRQTDVVARWGGEEFLILCRDTNEQGALTLAGKIRKTLQQADFPCAQAVTASIGLSSVAEAQNLEDLIKLADLRMYEAKRSGKDRIVHQTKLAG
ncbi:GGDEF domain-containing protein [Terasakiella pusilla]|uniref:GGDEF domain-containing protein n=1 Tax=Terasakiella pusilla TaxID=64973 RepID=UPI003AA8A613